MTHKIVILIARVDSHDVKHGKSNGIRLGGSAPETVFQIYDSVRVIYCRCCCALIAQGTPSKDCDYREEYDFVERKEVAEAAIIDSREALELTDHTYKQNGKKFLEALIDNCVDRCAGYEDGLAEDKGIRMASTK
jgi:hypothetical protein